MIKDYKPEMIMDYLDINGYNQLTLIINENCNLRCKYCIFSSEYDDFRMHNTKKMTFETAKRGIDLFMEKVIERRKKEHYFIPTIGFYGGEPLLNFKLIKECICYIEKEYKITPEYTLTSNLTILTNEMIKFIVENKIFLAISLNGNKIENDKYRVDSRGYGTFKIIDQNIDRLINLGIDCNRCGYVVTYDTTVNLLDLNDFFGTTGYKGIQVILMNPVTPIGTDWYEKNVSEIDEMHFESDYTTLFENYKKRLIDGEKITSVQLMIFTSKFIQILNRRKEVFSKNPHHIFIGNGSCVPGEKLALNPDGNFLICERVNYDFTIGQDINGLDYTKISELIYQANAISDKCVSCPIKTMCARCFNQMGYSNQKLSSFDKTICDKYIENIKKSLVELYSLFEIGITDYQIIESANVPKKKEVL